jgi:dTDP-4-dehydrorhamnose 3,5-epimerase
MEFRNTGIEGLIEIYPKIFKDERGYFTETYHKEAFQANGIPFDFVQDNQSYSTKGVLRGLHFQNEPFAQGKLVKVAKGKVLDIAVDIRKDSPTFGQYRKFLLTETDQNMVYIPVGFAHGFLALEDAIFTYKCTNFYNKTSESGILWNDPDLAIDWDIKTPNVSPKDLTLPKFKNIFDLISA